MTDRNRNQAILFCGLVISTAGTYLLLIHLSATVFAKTNSSVLSSLVFAAQWLLPVFWQSAFSNPLKRFKLREKLVLFELASAIVSLIIGLNFNLLVLLALLVVRGLFELGTKSTRIQATKVYFDGPDLSRFSSLTQLGQILGIAVGAILSFSFAETFDLLQVALIDAISFAIAGSFYLLLPNVKSLCANSKRSKSDVGLPKHLRSIVTRLAVITAVFQGAHNVLRVTLPMVFLKMTSAGVGITQMCFIFGVMIGAAATSIWPGHQLFKRAVALSALAFGFLAISLNAKGDVTLALTAYTLMAFVFELIFLNFFNEALRKSSKEDIAEVSASLALWPSAAMSVSVPLFGLTLDTWGPNAMIAGSFAVFVIVWYLTGTSYAKKEVGHR